MAKATKHQLMHSKKCWVVLTQIWVWTNPLAEFVHICPKDGLKHPSIC